MDSGELRQVGSGCLRDFLGGHDPERACRQAEYLALARERTAGRRGQSQAARARRSGLRRARRACQCAPTATSHASRHNARASQQAPTRHCAPCTTPARHPTAATAPSQPALFAGRRRSRRSRDELSQFETDALAAIESRSVSTRRERGLICALIAAYRQRRARSRHLAQPGERLGTECWSSGSRLCHRSATAPSIAASSSTRTSTVWPGGRPGETAAAGGVVSLDGTVERHTRFGTGAVTVLSHCTTEILAEPEGVSDARPGT